jgi:serine/threonine protein kinase
LRGYKIGELIGRGGFGTVHAAIQYRDSRPVAVKFVTVGDDEGRLARFRRELRLQGELVNPHVVPILDLAVDEDPAWCVMPLAETSLASFLTTPGFNRDEALALFHDAGIGLGYAHEQGVLHRDIKPDNILLFRNGGGLTAALSDFGLGRRLERDTPTLTQTNAGMGTPGYMAPEQYFNAKDVDERADIYSMGRVLFHILSGKTPPAVRDIDLSLVDSKYAYIVRKATYEDPDRRYRTLGAFTDDLLLAERPTQSGADVARLARELSARIATPAEPQSGDLEDLARLLAANLDDFNLVVHVLPRMPYDVINRLFAAHNDLLWPVFLRYDATIAEQIPVSYCIMVAALYEAIYNATSGVNYQAAILKRLVALGAKHNDWQLGNLVQQLLTDTDDPEVLGQLREYLGNNPAEAAWCRQFLYQAQAGDPTQMF